MCVSLVNEVERDNHCRTKSSVSEVGKDCGEGHPVHFGVPFLAERGSPDPRTVSLPVGTHTIKRHRRY